MAKNQSIDWDLAEKVAARTAGTDPIASSYLYDSLASDLSETTFEACSLVSRETNIPLDQTDVSMVVSRAAWLQSNLRVFQTLIGPIADKVTAKNTNGFISAAGRKITATELGVLLGWMSRRVLGQYDIFGEGDPSDVIYYVGPNVLAIEKRYAFSPREFRLWIALHEATHRAQFVGVPWMHAYFTGLISELVDSFDPDSRKLFGAVRKAAKAAREDAPKHTDLGVLGYVATPEQQIVMSKLQALMSILEGHSDVVMNRAGGDRVPNATRFHHIFHERRMSASGFGGALQRLLGFEAKMRQYRSGARFIEYIDREKGSDAVALLWKSPDNMPTLAEIDDPSLWLAREHADVLDS